VSWFDIQVGGSEFSYGVGGLSEVEIIDYGFLGLSFSDFPVWSYFIFLFSFLVLVRSLFLVVGGLVNKLPVRGWMLAVILFVLLGYLLYSVFLLWNVRLVDIPGSIREGEFGDSFGTLNALFSGLAFSGVLLTLLFQRKDLAATRLQIAHQAFESQFYSMLNHQQEIVRNFDLHNTKNYAVIAQGRDCFRFWDRYIRSRYWQYASIPAKLDPHVFAYNQVFKEHGADLGLYFRSLYSLFRIIEQSDHPKKEDFAILVRSLLSSYELKMLFYNCLTPQGSKFTVYVDRFSLFDNLDDSMVYRQEHLSYFSMRSYGNNHKVISKLKENQTAS
jgi:hypothetical protein